MLNHLATSTGEAPQKRLKVAEGQVNAERASNETIENIAEQDQVKQRRRKRRRRESEKTAEGIAEIAVDTESDTPEDKKVYLIQEVERLLKPLQVAFENKSVKITARVVDNTMREAVKPTEGRSRFNRRESLLEGLIDGRRTTAS